MCEEVLLSQCKSCFSEGCRQLKELEMHVRCLQSEGESEEFRSLPKRNEVL